MLAWMWMSLAFAQEPGDVIHGAYTVARITVNGETEDYREKMERADRALDEDCITRALLFDFGGPPAEGAVAHRPPAVEVLTQQECKRGGLGVYGSEVSTIIPTTWGAAEGGGITLSTAKVEVVTGYTRLREPADGDMRTPPHWLAPEQRIQRDALTYVVEVDKARGKARPVMRLTSDGTTLHLEPVERNAAFGPR